jgi:hypothetical protein
MIPTQLELVASCNRPTPKNITKSTRAPLKTNYKATPSPFLPSHQAEARTNIPKSSMTSSQKNSKKTLIPLLVGRKQRKNNKKKRRKTRRERRRSRSGTTTTRLTTLKEPSLATLKTELI